MILLASEGFGFAFLRNNPTWDRVASWFDHVPWQGAVFWDMIQPSFMFMAGVALPYALARRTAEGATFHDNMRHVLVRAAKLIILSEILIWVSANQIKPQLINVLAQLAFTYALSFLIMQARFRWQVVIAAGLLAGWTALLFAFPGPDGPFSKTGSVGLQFDRLIFHYDYDPAYSTLNFIPSTVWTLSGVWAGMLFRSQRTHAERLKILAACMMGAFAVGLGLSPWIPMIKQLCTASFILYSLGWVLFMLIGFYCVVEILGYRRWTFPLLVVGMNSIFIYSLSMLLHGWLNRAVAVFTRGFTWIGTLAPVAQSCAVLAVMWCACYWLYRRKIFLKL